MGKTRISWTDETIQPIRGCSPVSAGCARCYAARQALRFRAPGKPYHGLVDHVPGRPPRFNGEIRADRKELAKPLHWNKPRRCFVCSMGDMFHAHIPEASILAVLSVLATSHQGSGSTFQILTKRPERARELLDRVRWRFAMVPLRLQEKGAAELLTHCAITEQGDRELPGFTLRETPKVNAPPWQGIPPGVWLGTSAEDQTSAEERLVELTGIARSPGGLRILSLEPLLGPVWIAPWLPSLDWVVVGAETGPGARPCELEWIHLVVQQCWAASVPCFVKATGPAKADKNPENWPADLRVRDWPS